jgi:hypothetical protein
VQIISEVVSAVSASVSIKDSKIGDLLPFSTVFRLGDVKNDSDSILIVISYGALISGCGIGFDMSIRLDTVFGRLKIRDGQQYFRQGRVRVFDNTNIPHSQIFGFGIQIHFLPNNFIRLSDR